MGGKKKKKEKKKEFLDLLVTDTRGLGRRAHAASVCGHGVLSDAARPPGHHQRNSRTHGLQGSGVPHQRGRVEFCGGQHELGDAGQAEAVEAEGERRLLGGPRVRGWGGARRVAGHHLGSGRRGRGGIGR